MNILFPTDFSELSHRALPFAIDLCKKTEGELVAMTAYDIPYGDRGISTISLLEAIKENAERNMENFDKELAEMDVDYRTEVMMGNPVRVIKDFAKREELDMVVMSTHGASGLEEILIGSNAASVIHGTEIPIMIIPPAATFKPIKRILFCTELAMLEDEKMLSDIKAIAEIYGASINILHIQKSNEQGARQHLQDHFGSIPLNFTIMKDDDVEEAILEHAKATGADLIAAMTKKYGFFEGLFHSSLTSKLAYHSHTPILAFHQK